MSTFTIPKFPQVTVNLHTELRRRVQEYFQQRGLEETGTPHLFTKAVLLIGCLVAV
ncbi:MAG: hypothetical protein IM541_08985, partial [Chitinophagaceae bacterium]|nr:hypothetical protein [Chitinophagaceae bacterium]